ncbi:MAG TPA: YhjD/YihY/BrkB family envelope integrity protein [Acidimicrobiales bacterium]|nr:YhjD/YihY/BrkB family envelope integrity protein [Acidimicrobiales bacterium]
MGAPPFVTRGLAAVDRVQRSNRILGPAYAVTKKVGDDNGNLFVVALGWYGFTAIYPLLLFVITVFGYIGAESLGTGVVNTLHQFPLIGNQFTVTHGGSNLHGSPAALVIGLVGLVYGAQGVTQTAVQTMATVWNVPRNERPGFAPRLARSLAGLAIIGGTFLLNSFLASLAAARGAAMPVRIVVIVGLAVLNIALFAAAFRVLTPGQRGFRQFVPGAVLAGLGFTALITVGSALVQHQLRHSSSTYGSFAAVIGVVAFLLLLAKLTVYSAELNPVLARHLWPRALVGSDPTEADRRVLRAEAHETRQRDDEQIDVRFEGGKAEGSNGDAPKEPARARGVRE